MYSLLLPSCFCDHHSGTFERPVAWRRQGLTASPTLRAVVRSSATGLLRVGAMALRHAPSHRAPASRWGLL